MGIYYLMPPTDMKNRMKFCRKIRKFKLGQDFWNRHISFYLDGKGFEYKTDPLDPALTQSPFLLGGTLEQYLLSYEGQHAKIIEEIRRSLYVDDVISGGYTIEEMQQFKDTAIQVFKDAGFSLHKWHSNEKQLEGDQIQIGDNEQMYTKQQLGAAHDQTKLLGLHWNKSEDMIAVTFPTMCGETSKR